MSASLPERDPVLLPFPPSAAMPAAVPRLKLNGEISLGHVMQAGMLGVGLIVWLVAGQGKTDGLVSRVSNLQEQVVATHVQSREEMRTGLGRVEGALVSIEARVALLPDLSARLRLLEEEAKRSQERDAATMRYLDERRSLMDTRFLALEQRAIEGAADRRELRGSLDYLRTQLDRASTVNLPGSRGSR